MGYELIDIRKSFQGKTVLNGVSLSLPDTGVTALFGPSGCGKTTLGHILLGLLAPDGGTAPARGEVIAAAVFQEDRFIENMSARENVSLVLRGHKKDRLAQAERWLRALGLDGESEKPVSRLSGGMRRRAALARALACEPKELLVLDEPFNGLDGAAKAAAIALIKEAAKTASVLLISHDPSDAEALGAVQRIRL